MSPRDCACTSLPMNRVMDHALAMTATAGILVMIDKPEVLRDIEDFDKKWKNWEISKGRGRLILLKMAERIEKETGDGPHPKPKNPIERGIYEFLCKCASGDLFYIRELLDRLDGKPKQQVEHSSDPDRPLFIAGADDLRSKLRGIITIDETSSGHTVQ